MTDHNPKQHYEILALFGFPPQVRAEGIPLWQVIEQEHHGLLSCGATYADVLRSIADEMPLHFDPWLQEHADVQCWLRSEADRAEAGE